MIEIIQITSAVIIICIAYQILIMPGELLQSWAKFINSLNNYESVWYKKLILCPYCLGGQLALWVSVLFWLTGAGINVFMSVPVSIVAIYFIVKNNFK